MATIIETQETAEEVRQRLAALKAETGYSWKQLGQKSGVAEQTLGMFCNGKYAGDNLRVAADVRRFLDGRATLALRQTEVLKAPEFLELPTSMEIMSALEWAHLGEIVAISCASGTSKTSTAEEYRRRYPNVWLATMSPSSSGVQPMLTAVLDAMGDAEAKGSPQQLSRRVMKVAANSGGLFIVDEAQELSEKAIDEVRSWYDKTGVGVALMGDERVIGRLGGHKRTELARLQSRISYKVVKARPTLADAEILIEAWGVTEPAAVRFLRGLVTKPGGLRGIAKTIKLAALMARGEDRALVLSDLQLAWAQRNTETMGA